MIAPREALEVLTLLQSPTPHEVSGTLDSEALSVPTAFDFLQIPWIAGGAVEELTSLVLPLVQQGLDAASTSTTSTSAAQSTSQAAHSTSVEGTVVAAYYADWAAAQLPPEAIDWSRFNWIDFGESREGEKAKRRSLTRPSAAFAVPDENFDLVFTQGNSEDLLHRLVAAGHAQGRSVKLSVGGWTGSGHFSRAVGSVSGRSKLCRSIISAYEKFNLDGIDLDWEYPNGEV